MCSQANFTLMLVADRKFDRCGAGGAAESWDFMKRCIDHSAQLGMQSLVDMYRCVPWGGANGTGGFGQLWQANTYVHNEWVERGELHKPTPPEVRWLAQQSRGMRDVAGLLLADDGQDLHGGDLSSIAWMRRHTPEVLPWINQHLDPSATAWPARAGAPFAMPELYDIDGSRAAADQARNLLGSLESWYSHATRAGQRLWPLLNLPGPQGLAPSLVRFQAYAALASGAKGLFWFCWGNGGAYFNVDRFEAAQVGVAPAYPVLRTVNSVARAWGAELLKHPRFAAMYHSDDSWAPSASSAMATAAHAETVVQQMDDELLASLLLPADDDEQAEGLLLLVVDKRLDEDEAAVPLRFEDAQDAAEAAADAAYDAAAAAAASAAPSAAHLSSLLGRFYTQGASRASAATAAAAAAAAKQTQGGPRVVRVRLNAALVGDATFVGPVDHGDDAPLPGWMRAQRPGARATPTTDSGSGGGRASVSASAAAAASGKHVAAFGAELQGRRTSAAGRLRSRAANAATRTPPPLQPGASVLLQTEAPHAATKPYDDDAAGDDGDADADADADADGDGRPTETTPPVRAVSREADGTIVVEATVAQGGAFLVRLTPAEGGKLARSKLAAKVEELQRWSHKPDDVLGKLKTFHYREYGAAYASKPYATTQMMLASFDTAPGIEPAALAAAGFNAFELPPDALSPGEAGLPSGGACGGETPAARALNDAMRHGLFGFLRAPRTGPAISADAVGAALDAVGCHPNLGGVEMLRTRAVAPSSGGGAADASAAAAVGLLETPGGAAHELATMLRRRAPHLLPLAAVQPAEWQPVGAAARFGRAPTLLLQLPGGQATTDAEADALVASSVGVLAEAMLATAPRADPSSQQQRLPVAAYAAAFAAHASANPTPTTMAALRAQRQQQQQAAAATQPLIVEVDSCAYPSAGRFGAFAALAFGAVGVTHLGLGREGCGVLEHATSDFGAIARWGSTLTARRPTAVLANLKPARAEGVGAPIESWRGDGAKGAGALRDAGLGRWADLVHAMDAHSLVSILEAPLGQIDNYMFKNFSTVRPPPPLLMVVDARASGEPRQMELRLSDAVYSYSPLLADAASGYEKSTLAKGGESHTGEGFCNQAVLGQTVRVTLGAGEGVLLALSMVAEDSRAAHGDERRAMPSWEQDEMVWGRSRARSRAQ